MKKIKILQIIEATTGGTRRHLFYLLKHLSLSRFEITLVYSNARGIGFNYDLQYYAKRGIKLIEIPMRRNISPLMDSIALLKMVKIMRAGAFDLVHAHSSKAGVLGRMAARISNISAIVYSPHCFAFQYSACNPYSRFYHWIEKHTSRFYDHLLCVSRAERHAALSYRICSETKIRVIENVVDPNILKPSRSRESMLQELNIPASALIVGMVACLRPQKGYRYFIEAIPKVIARCPSAYFLIIGDGEERKHVEDQICSLGLARFVSLVGYQEQIADFYQLFALLVLSSLWEGMPYAILEAMELGIPVVASDIMGNNELIFHGENGFLTQVGNSSDIADRIIQLLLSRELRTSMSGNHLRRADSRFSIEEWIQTYEHFYLEATGNVPS